MAEQETKTEEKPIRTRRSVAKKPAKRKAAPKKNTSKRTSSKPRAQVESKDFETSGEHDIDLASTVQEVERPDLIEVSGETLESPGMKDFLWNLAFMEDKLTIMVNETTDENAENPVACGVNGEIKTFIRGQTYPDIKRKFVDSLIKREETVKTKQYKDDDDVQQTKVLKSHALKYPLSIIHDPAGDTGRRWFAWACENAF